MPLKNGYVEILKLGVTKEYRKRGIGKKLMLHCIDVAKKEKFEKIYLTTNKKLYKAIQLYRKLGFTEVSFSHSNYEMADCAMMLDLPSVSPTKLISKV